jgi:hypothetical protein
MKTKGLDTTAYERQLSDLRRTMAESVRSAVALPAYKRAYAKAVRPSYLESIQSALDDAEDAQAARWERRSGSRSSRPHASCSTCWPRPASAAGGGGAALDLADVLRVRWDATVV